VLTNGERYMVYRGTEGDRPDETLVVDCSLEELTANEDVLAMLSQKAD